jgi:hypothetical protein
MINTVYISLGVYSVTHQSIAFYRARSEENSLCNQITLIEWIDAHFWLVNYLVNLILWQYPIIYIFWPRKPIEK